MALIKCSECGREISDKAPACLGCGNPVQHQINIQDQVKKEPLLVESLGKTTLKIGFENKVPKRASLDTIIALFITDLILYWVISIANKDFATGFFWFIIIYIGIPVFLYRYIKLQRISYVLESDKITINKGILMKNSNTINYNLITNINIERSIGARIFGLSNVLLVTANAFSAAWVTLKKDDAEWLKNYILEKRHRS